MGGAQITVDITPEICDSSYQQRSLLHESAKTIMIKGKLVPMPLEDALSVAVAVLTLRRGHALSARDHATDGDVIRLLTSEHGYHAARTHALTVLAHRREEATALPDEIESAERAFVAIWRSREFVTCPNCRATYKVDPDDPSAPTQELVDYITGTGSAKEAARVAVGCSCVDSMRRRVRARGYALGDPSYVRALHDLGIR